MVPEAEAVAAAGAQAAGDLLPWTLSNSVKLHQWADVLPMGVEEAIAVVVTAAAEAAATVAVDPAEDAEVPAGAAVRVLPGAVHKDAAGVDLPQWIPNSAGKSLPWVDVLHMVADEAAMAAVGIAGAEAAATDAVPEAAEVPVEAAPAVEAPGADHVK